MGCRHHEFEMSLSLDGRLPSGRRTTLLHHIATCDHCGAVWEDMKRAQDLALSLPTRHHVRPGFREDLQARIASGEGPPDAIYRDPVTFKTKVRYVMTGAAAALVLIATANLVRSGDLFGLRDGGSTSAEGDIAQAPPPAEMQLPDSNDMGTSRGEFRSNLQPVSEYTLAQNFAQNCATSTHRLRARLKTVENRPLEESWPEVRDVLVQFRASINAMQWLEQREIVTLPGELRTDLDEAGRSLQVVFGNQPWQTRSRALQRLRRMRLERVRDSYLVKCCRPAEEIVSELGELMHNLPETRTMVRVIIRGADLQPSHRGQRGYFLIETEQEVRETRQDANERPR